MLPEDGWQIVTTTSKAPGLDAHKDANVAAHNDFPMIRGIVMRLR